MKNLRQYCADCGTPYGIADEVCPECGFDPCDGGPDEQKQQKAEKQYEEWHST